MTYRDIGWNVVVFFANEEALLYKIHAYCTYENNLKKICFDYKIS